MPAGPAPAPGKAPPAYKPDVWRSLETITAAKLAEQTTLAEGIIVKSILRNILHATSSGMDRGERFIALNDRQIVELNQHPTVKTELERLGYKVLVVSNSLPPRLNMFLTW